MQNSFLVGTIVVLGLALIVVLISNWRQKRPSPPVVALASDIEYRSRLARAVTTWALAAIATLGAVIVSFAGYNAFIASTGQGVDASTRKEAVDQFLRVAQYVLGSLLPVVAAWVGTVLAFYFGRENYEAAAKSASALVRQLTSKEKLQSKTAREAMLKINEVTAYRIPAGTTESQITLQTLITDGFEKDKSKPRNRLPIIDSGGRGKYVLHRSTLDGFIVAAKNEKAAPPVTEATLTLDKLIADPKYKDTMSKSFLAIAETSSLADAKDLLDKNPTCLDLLVTPDGFATSVVTGWITNVIVLNEAIL